VKDRANKGFRKVVWTTVVIMLFFLVLGAILWWLDGVIIRPS